MSKKKIEPIALQSGYVPTEKEAPIIRNVLHRLRADKAPRIALLNKNTAISFHHPDLEAAQLLLVDALGAGSTDFLRGILQQLAGAVSEDLDPEAQLNFMISVMKDIAPRDQVEAMLAAQMASVHVMAIRYVHRIAMGEMLSRQDSIEGLFIKLTRTFVAQMEALKRYRADGEKKTAAPEASWNNSDRVIAANKDGADKSAQAKNVADRRSAATTGAKVVPMKRKADE
jgi:hypothetical protein